MYFVLNVLNLRLISRVRIVSLQIYLAFDHICVLFPTIQKLSSIIYMFTFFSENNEMKDEKTKTALH